MIMVSVCLPSDGLLQTSRLAWVSLTLDKGYVLTAAPPDLEHGVARLGPPAPGQPESTQRTKTEGWAGKHGKSLGPWRHS